MLPLLRLHDGGCSMLVLYLVRLAQAIDEWRRFVALMAPELERWLRGSLRKLWRLYLRHRGVEPLRQPVRRRRAANRISPEVEEKILRYHLGWPSIGAGTLKQVLYRHEHIDLARETIRNVIRRNKRRLAELQSERRRTGRFQVELPRKLWGIDVTLVWVLGFVPLWIVGIVDHHGSYLVALEPVPWPSSSHVAAVIERAVERQGAPSRVLTDRGPEFRAPPFTATLARLSVEHTRTRQHHPWTNGRIERLFRTFKETVRSCYWVVGSRLLWADICREFVVFYNHHRPHSSFGGRTPAEVYAGRERARYAEEATFFRGRLRWWRFT